MDPTAAFFDLSPDALAIATTDCCFYRTNPAWEPMLGYRKDELEGMRIFDLMHPDDVAGAQEVLSSVGTGAPTRDFMARYRHRDGSWRYVAWRATPAVSGLIYASARDVTAEVTRRNDMAAAEASHRTLFDSIRQGVVYQSPGGRIESANTAAQEILGLTLDQLQGRTSIDPAWRAVQPDLSDFPGELHPSMEVLRTGQPVCDVDVGVFNPATGKYRWLRVDAQPVQRDGETWSVTTITDITTLREAVATGSELRQAIDEHVILSVADTTGVITDANDKFCTVSGYSRDELIGHTHRIINSGHHDREFFAEMWRTIKAGKIWQGEILNKNKSGSTYWVLSTIVPLRDYSGAIRQFISIRTDISAQKQAEREASAASLLDELTGLPNRRHFDAELASRLEHSKATGQPLATVMLDIDFFKEFNDTYGHRHGDSALIAVADVLATVLRAGDFLARWGGEEFAVILPGASLRAAETVANRLREAVSAEDLLLPGHDRLTISAGVAVSTASAGHSPESLLEAADKELYRAKSAGRNQVRAGS